MSEAHDTDHSSPPAERHRVRLPGFVTDESIGLGDVVKRITTAAGVRPCGGCAERAHRLNNWLVFTNRRN